MTFIIVFISLLIERFFNWSHLRQWTWFNRYRAWLNDRFSGWTLDVVMTLYFLPPLVIVFGLNWLLTGWFFSIFKMIFCIAVLLYCLGPTNFWADVYSTLHELHGGTPVNKLQLANTFHVHAHEDTSATHTALARAFFIAANERVFAVLFWFVLLGPVGALLYRLMTLSPVPKGKQLFDWLPVRLLALIFALGGHFTEVMKNWRHGVGEGLNTNNQLLTKCGMAALDPLGKESVPTDEGLLEREALDLLDRSFIIGLVILAFFVLLL